MSNSYIVVFKPESDGEHASTNAINDLASKVEGSGGSIKHRYDSKVMRGFAGSFSEDLKSELEQVRRPPPLPARPISLAELTLVYACSTRASSTSVRLVLASLHSLLALAGAAQADPPPTRDDAVLPLLPHRARPGRQHSVERGSLPTCTLQEPAMSVTSRPSLCDELSRRARLLRLGSAVTRRVALALLLLTRGTRSRDISEHQASVAQPASRRKLLGAAGASSSTRTRILSRTHAHASSFVSTSSASASFISIGRSSCLESGTSARPLSGLGTVARRPFSSFPPPLASSARRPPQARQHLHPSRSFSRAQHPVPTAPPPPHRLVGTSSASPSLNSPDHHSTTRPFRQQLIAHNARPTLPRQHPQPRLPRARLAHTPRRLPAPRPRPSRLVFVRPPASHAQVPRHRFKGPTDGRLRPGMDERGSRGGGLVAA